MKPEQNGDAGPSITGDVIGNTAYSERFVLKILLKFANLDTLKDEVKEKSFEEDLCILWDMTAERDVVVFLQKHDTLKLFLFALPTIESSRIIEIVVGIIGNMCCENDVVSTLLNMEPLLRIIMEYLKTDDVPTLIQVLRLVNACLFVAQNEDVIKWLDLFQSIEYSSTLNYILRNSSNKDLLVNALENLNTICSQCNIEQNDNKFFSQFVNLDSLETLCVAFAEITKKHKDNCEKEEFERILVISLQILLTLVGFNVAKKLYKDKRKDVSELIRDVLSYFEDNFVNKKEVDDDLVDIMDSAYTILSILGLSETDALDQFFNQSLNMWIAIHCIHTPGTNQNESNGSISEKCQSEDRSTVHNITKELKGPLSSIMCMYMQSCSDNNLLAALDKLGKHFDDITSVCNEKDVVKLIRVRTENYRTRVNENIDS